MHTFTYGMPPKRLPTSTIHQNAYQLQIRLPAYHMLTCLPAYHISRGHKRLPAYLLTTCPVATDHSNAEMALFSIFSQAMNREKHTNTLAKEN